MAHSRGGPRHPMMRGIIERWHRSIKSQVLLENYLLRGVLEARIVNLTNYYDIRRCSEPI